jgi:DNA-directed RNA polymerase subunit RPC12/RpoP
MLSDSGLNARTILRSTQFQRLLLAILPLLLVDLLLIIISLTRGVPSLTGIIKVNLIAIAILALRFSYSFYFRLRCPSCRQAFGNDTGERDYGYPVFQCPRCGFKWPL